MLQDEPRFSLAELVDASGVPEGTIRAYIKEGLIPASIGRGRARYYTPQHLERLELVARLRADRVSIVEIRERLLREAAPVTPSGDTWRRIALHPDLELHVRADAPDAVDSLVDELVAQSRRWFGEV